MGIKTEDLPEVRVQRNAQGRVVKYAVEINGELVWLWVPERLRTEGLSFIGDDVLRTLPHFLRRQAE